MSRIYSGKFNTNSHILMKGVLVAHTKEWSRSVSLSLLKHLRSIISN